VVGSLDLVRLPLGLAEREALRARRAGPASGARFARLLLPMRLRSMPLPVPQLTIAYFLALWEDSADLEAFRAGPLRGWERSSERLALDLEPTQSFGSWLGGDPFDGHRAEPRPGPTLLVTHSRVRPRSMLRFMRADGPVVRALETAPGRLWSNGFGDGIVRMDSGTLSLWQTTEDALRFAYAPGIHSEAVAAMKTGGWFSEAWFARFAVTAARGSWGGVDAAALG
jgi:hypothetical protein